MYQSVLTPGSTSATASQGDVARAAGGIAVRGIQNRKVAEGGVAKEFGEFLVAYVNQP